MQQTTILLFQKNCKHLCTCSNHCSNILLTNPSCIFTKAVLTFTFILPCLTQLLIGLKKLPLHLFLDTFFIITYSTYHSDLFSKKKSMENNLHLRKESETLNLIMILSRLLLSIKSLKICMLLKSGLARNV